MKRATKAKVNSAILAALISIPIVIAKINASQPKPEAGVRTPSDAEIELQIAWNTSTEPVEIPIVASTIQVIEIETTTELATEPETTTEAAFSGYDFIPLDMDIQVQIFTLCQQYDIAFDLILSVIKTESEFQWLIGDNGKSIGYMQIQPQWWQGLADAAGLNISDPLDNVQLGILILADALNANMGDLDKALKQYKSGNPNYQGNEYINVVYANYQWILEMKEGE